MIKDTYPADDMEAHKILVDFVKKNPERKIESSRDVREILWNEGYAVYDGMAESVYEYYGWKKNPVRVTKEG
jgi:hypothetical protein